MSDARHAFLVEAAWLHYDFGLTQEEIAARFGVSRSTVSRALADALTEGIVRIVVTEPMPSEALPASQLVARLGVAATVGKRVGDEAGSLASARAASRLIERIASADRMTIATSWGRTLASAAQLVRPRATAGITVVDAVGHTGRSRVVPAVEVNRTLANALGAHAVHIPSPAFVRGRGLYESLVASRPVEEALALARSADVTLVSIGVVGPQSLLVLEGLVRPAEMEDAVQAGAVGETLGHWFDRDGREVDIAGLHAVGLSLEDIRTARRAIAVGGGAEKAPALHAAIRGGLIREVVVDDELGAALLAEEADSAYGTDASTRPACDVADAVPARRSDV